MLATETALSWQAGQGVGSITAQPLYPLPATNSTNLSPRARGCCGFDEMVGAQLHELPGGLGRSQRAGV